MAAILLLASFILRAIALSKAIVLVKNHANWRFYVFAGLVALSVLATVYQAFNMAAWNEATIAAPILYLVISILIYLGAYYAAFYALELARKEKRFGEFTQVFNQFTQKTSIACFVIQGNRFVYTNPAFHMLTGLDGPALRHFDYWKIAASEYLKDMKFLGSEMNQESSGVQSNIQLIDARGKRTWVQITAGGVMHQNAPAIAGTMLDINEQFEYQSRLEKTENQLRLAIEAAGISAWDYDRPRGEFTIIESDSSNADPSQDGIRKLDDLAEMVHPDDRARLTEDIQKSLTTRERFDIDFRLVKDHSRFEWWTVSGRVLTSKGNDPTRIVGIARCIHEAKKTEELIRANEERLRIATEIAGIQVWEWIVGSDTVTHRIGQIDNACGKVTGFEDFRRRLHPDEKQQVLDALTKVIANGSRYDEEFRLLGDDGTYYWHRSVGQIFAREGETTRRMLGAAIDISKIRENEMLIQQQLDQLKAMWQTIPDSVLQVDGSGNLLEAKIIDDFALILRDEPREGRRLSEVFPDAVANHLQKSIQVCLESNTMQMFEYSSVVDDTPYYFEARLSPGGNDRVLIVIRDITEQNVLQQTIIDISAQQQRRIGQDLHDELGQMLTGISFRLATLQQDLKGAHAPTQVQVAELGNLVEKAIKQTRLLAEGLNPVTLDMHGLRTGLERLALQTQEIYGVPCPFECNQEFSGLNEEIASQVYRIGQEAINNAIKHAGPNTIKIKLEEEDGISKLIVEDNGSGFRHTPLAGNGLGLRIMQYRARVIGATLDIDSQPTAGTRITCSFPSRRAINMPV